MDDLSQCTTELESLIIKVTNLPKPIYIGVVYRPNDGDLNKFYEKLNAIFETLPKEGTFIMGDYNIDLLKSKPNNDYEHCIYSNGFNPLISIKTHDRPNTKSSCIDNIHTNDPETVLISGTISDNITHHLPVFHLSNIEMPPRGLKEKQTQHYDYSNENLTRFTHDLEDKVNNLTPSVNFSEFTDLFENTLNKHCKLPKPKTTKRTTNNNPWITDSLINAIERKHELKKAWSKSKSKKLPSGDPILHEKFRTYRKVLTGLIKKAKSSFHTDKISNCVHDRKKVWKIKNELRGKQQAKIKPSFNINNKKVINRRIIANEFNKYFISIACKLNEGIENGALTSEHSLPSFYDYLNPPNSNSIVMYDCDKLEVMDIIKEFQNNKASDYPIRIIKKCSHFISPILSQYYNILLQNGTFPDNLKVGKITPIYKKGDSELLENYRPISILPIFGKIFEKLIYKRLYSFLSSQNILFDNQYGFRKSHSTSHAVNHSITHVTTELSKNKHVLGIFIDLSKAFDTIDHDTLVKKLDHYGIRGEANNLLKSYLSNRTQYTECLEEKSGPLLIRYGVPQGSILGPLLFILYINDIVNCSNLGMFLLFADDTNIFVSGSTKLETYQKANELLASLSKYMASNKLHINMGKCCFIEFKAKNKTNNETSSDDDNHKLYLDDIPIKKVKATKFLGITIDEELNWNQHFLDLKRKLYHSLSTLNRIKHCVPDNLHKDLYFTLFESHLGYGISVWGGSPQSKLDKIHKIQKKVIRIMFGDTEAYQEKFKTCARTREFGSQKLGSEFYEKEHTKPIFKKHGILAVQNLYNYHCFNEVHKILKEKAPYPLYNEYTISRRKYLTHIQILPPAPAVHFIYRSSIIWNIVREKLGLNDILGVSYSQIKTKLKLLLLNNQQRHDELNWHHTHDFDITKL